MGKARGSRVSVGVLSCNGVASDAKKRRLGERRGMEKKPAAAPSLSSDPPLLPPPTYTLIPTPQQQ